MKGEELRGKTKDQLGDQLLDLRKEQFNLRFQRVSGQLENTARVRQVRRDIARIKTVLNRMQSETQAQAVNKFNTDVTGRAEFIKIYYGISCECSTAAVLSVEAAADKTRAEFQEALPGLLGKLKLQGVGFRRMDCDSHLQMRIQNLPGAR